MFCGENYGRVEVLMYLWPQPEKLLLKYLSYFCLLLFCFGLKRVKAETLSWIDKKKKMVCSHEREKCCVSNEHRFSFDWCSWEILRCNRHKCPEFISRMQHCLQNKQSKTNAYSSRVPFNWIQFCHFVHLFSLPVICIIAMSSPADDDEKSNQLCCSLFGSYIH